MSKRIDNGPAVTGYGLPPGLAPLAFALPVRGDSRFRHARNFSWTKFALVGATIALNLCSLDRSGALWAAKPVCGLAQSLPSAV